MANEPERPIEKLLRDAARKRRDMAGAPFELHPATRRLLQGEVTRRFAKRQGEARSFSTIVAQLWPRFAWGLGILAVLGVAVWVLLPGTIGDKPQTFLARNQPVSRSDADPSATAASPHRIRSFPCPADGATANEAIGGGLRGQVAAGARRLCPPTRRRRAPACQGGLSSASTQQGRR